MKKPIAALALVGAGLFAYLSTATAAIPTGQPSIAEDSPPTQLAQAQPAPAKKGATAPTKNKGKATKSKTAKAKKAKNTTSKAKNKSGY
jgi:hypothetical protein